MARAVAILMALAGCVPITQEQVARETARGVIRPILADRFPGIPVEPLTDCVIDSATVPELYALAETVFTGLTPAAINTITDIAIRPETVACLATDGIGGVLDARRTPWSN